MLGSWVVSVAVQKQSWADTFPDSARWQSQSQTQPLRLELMLVVPAVLIVHLHSIFLWGHQELLVDSRHRIHRDLHSGIWALCKVS